MPASWVGFHSEHLLKAAANYPIISISRQPIDIGHNVLDTGPKGYWNQYIQMLNAARMADTPFVAMAEDDTLYTRQHFESFRPPATAVAYDRSRWSLFTWDPIFCLRQRISNCSMLAPRMLLIEALEERAAKWPNGAPKALIGEIGREKVDKRLGVTVRDCAEWYSRGPIVQLNHPTGNDTGDYGYAADGRHMVKKHGQIQAVEIPYWGRAEDIVKHYFGDA